MTEAANVPATQEPRKTLAHLLQTDAVVNQLRLALPKHITAERMARIALTELRRNPKLGLCTQESFLGALMQSAQLGLEPGPMGLAYLIPYKNEVTLQIGYKGLVALAWRSKEIASIHADVVCENDYFEFERGTKSFLRHRPTTGDRGAKTYVYAVVDVKGGGSLFEVMTADDIDDHRTRYSQSKKDSPWDSAWDAMARKTVVKRVLKLAPVSSELLQAVNLDDLAEVGASQAIGREIDITPAASANEVLGLDATAEEPAEPEGADVKAEGSGERPILEVICECGSKDEYPVGTRLPCTAECGRLVVVNDEGAVSFEFFEGQRGL